MTKKKKRPTIKDIAKIAGVSHVTVSQALRDFNCISQPTKERIRQIAKDIGYTPNMAARNLALQKPTSIGMIVPDMGSNTAYCDLVPYISSLAAKDNMCLLLGSCNRSIELEKTYCRMMCDNMVGALIISPCSSEVNHINEICKDKIPVIYVGGKSGQIQQNYILPDTVDSGKTVVDYLYQIGHRDIALFLYHPDNQTIQYKLAGYTQAMEEHDLTPQVYWHGESNNTYQAGFDLTNQLMNQHKLPSAIWCASDLMAYGVMDALRLLEKDQHVSVVGHDDLFFSGQTFADLTTMALPKDEIAEKAYAFARILMEDPSKECQAVVKNHLIVRSSTLKPD